jgi:hypothetical protein
LVTYGGDEAKAKIVFPGKAVFLGSTDWSFGSKESLI